jgi:acyl-CoA dehydrogenase
LIETDFLFEQGPTKGLGKIQFHDYRPAYDSVDLPNINIFKQQIDVLKEFMTQATPNEDQQKDIDFLLIVGELFTLVVYGQLIIEKSRTQGLDKDILDRIFDVMVRDFSKFALQLYSKPSATARQMEICLKMLQKPNVDHEQFDRVWKNHVFSLADAYEMNP